MRKLRSVNTLFWDDGYIIDRDPIEKLLFLYLLTNPLTTVAGVYELSLRKAAFDTGVDKEMIEKIFGRFERDGKIIYRDDWVVLLNFFDNQKMNPNMAKGAATILNGVPEWVIDALVKHSKGFKSLSNTFEGFEKYKSKFKENMNMNVKGNAPITSVASTITVEADDSPNDDSPNDDSPPTLDQPDSFLLDPNDFTYPLRELVEAFPNMNLTPSAMGFIESSVKAEDKIPWQRTIRKYQMNYDPLKRQYLPEKTANLLGVFEDEKRRYEREQNGTNTKSPNRRTDEDVFRETAEFYANYNG